MAISNIRFEDWEAEQMRDSEFRVAVEKLEPVYQAELLRLAEARCGGEGEDRTTRKRACQMK